MKSKVNLIVILIMFASILSYGQKLRVSIQDAVNNLGIVITELEKQYLPAIDLDTAKCAFKEKQQQDKFAVAFFEVMREDLRAFLKSNNFSLGKETRCFYRVYISKNGEIDHFFYNITEGKIEKNTEEEFNKLLTAFFQAYEFPVKSKIDFSQCESIRLTNW